MRRVAPCRVQLMTEFSISLELGMTMSTPSLSRKRVARGPTSTIKPRAPSTSTKSPTLAWRSKMITRPDTNSRTIPWSPRPTPTPMAPANTANEVRFTPSVVSAAKPPAMISP